MGFEKIARLLNLQNTPTKTGAEWSAITIRRMLANPVLGGRIALADGTIVAKHEAIIPWEQFQLAQEIYSGRKKYPNRSQQSQYLLSGIMRCSGCSRCLVGHVITQGKQRKTYQFYYHRPTVGTKDRPCAGFAKSVQIVDSIVIEQIARFASSGIVETAVQQEVKKRHHRDAVPKVERRDKLLLASKDLERAFNRADRLDAGKIDEQQFEQQNRRLLERKKTIQEQLTKLEQELGEEEALELSVKEVCQALRQFLAVWETLEHEERREVLRLVIEGLHVSKTPVEPNTIFDPVIVPFR